MNGVRRFLGGPNPQQQQSNDYYFDPYSDAQQQQPYPTYDQGAPYRDDDFQPPYAHPSTGSSRTAVDSDLAREKDQPFSAEVLGLSTQREGRCGLNYPSVVYVR